MGTSPFITVFHAACLSVGRQDISCNGYQFIAISLSEVQQSWTMITQMPKLGLIPSLND